MELLYGISHHKVAWSHYWVNLFDILCQEMRTKGKIELPLLCSPERGNVRPGVHFVDDMHTLLGNICSHIEDEELAKDIQQHFQIAILAYQHYNDPEFTLVLESTERGKLGAVLDWKTPVFVHCRFSRSCVIQ